LLEDFGALIVNVARFAVKLAFVVVPEISCDWIWNFLYTPRTF
jgi:hypothetical protein